MLTVVGDRSIPERTADTLWLRGATRLTRVDRAHDLAAYALWRELVDALVVLAARLTSLGLAAKHPRR